VLSRPEVEIPEHTLLVWSPSICCVGALLNLIALESIVDVDDQGKILLNGTLTKTIDLKNIPLLGKRYDVRVRPGVTTLLLAGKEVLSAKGDVVKFQPD
jgi:hypothetical protein